MNTPTRPSDRATLRLIGRFRLKAGNDAVVDVPSRRARALLAYLALAPERTASRERLRGLLWSDRAEAQARASLRQCLLELRGALTTAGLDLLDISREAVGFRTDIVDVDVEALEIALSGGAEALAARLTTIAADRLLDDLEIGGLFDDWRTSVRERLDRAIASAVRSRLDALIAEAKWSGARTLAEAFLQRDRLDETVAAVAIRADIALGATSAAHRRYQALETDLRKELGVAPGAATRAALSSTPPAVQPTAAPPTPASMPVVDIAERKTLPLPDRPSIAVMPFKNLSGDPEQEYFADAITEDIVNALSRWRWFFVINRESSFIYKNLDVDADLFGSELGIRYVLRGSVRKTGSRVRITAQLIDAREGAYLWTEKYDRTLDDILDVQDEITEHVVSAIEPAILRGEGARVSRKMPADFSTLDFFYRGMWHFNRMSDADDLEALRLFETVIAKDPELSLGHVGVARVLYSRAVLGWSDDPIADLEQGRESARTAIRLDALDAHGYFAASGASLYLGDHKAALEDARKANALNPNFGYGAYRLGQVLIFSGHPAEAIRPIERSIRLNPYDPQISLMIGTLALACFHARDYVRAAEHARSSVNLGNVHGNYILAAALAMSGLDDAAAEACSRFKHGAASRSRALATPYADPVWKEHLQAAFRGAGTVKPSRLSSDEADVYRPGIVSSQAR